MNCTNPCLQVGHKVAVVEGLELESKYSSSDEEGCGAGGEGGGAGRRTRDFFFLHNVGLPLGADLTCFL